MTDQQKNPEVDKENEAYASDESLFPNNEMKPEKRIGNSVILSIALIINNRFLCNNCIIDSVICNVYSSAKLEIVTMH